MVKEDRDSEKAHSEKAFVVKLRRLADGIENGKKFEIQVAGEGLYFPVRVKIQY